MTTFEKYTLGLQLAGVFVTGLSAVFIVLQIWFASRGLQLDHDRQRRQATVEFLLFHIRPQWRTGRKKIEGRWGKERLTQESVNKILADDDARDEIRELLSTLEHMAVGIHEGVYDKEIVRRASCKYLIRLHDRLEPYIREVQKTHPTAYVEFEKLITGFTPGRRSG